MAQEGPLQSRDAYTMLGLHLRAFDVADSRSELLMVGHRLHLPQVSRGTIERAQDAGANRGEREMRQAMSRAEVAADEHLGKCSRQSVDPAHPLEQQQAFAGATARVRPEPARPLDELAHQR